MALTEMINSKIIENLWFCWCSIWRWQERRWPASITQAATTPASILWKPANPSDNRTCEWGWFVSRQRQVGGQSLRLLEGQRCDASSGTSDWVHAGNAGHNRWTQNDCNLMAEHTLEDGRFRLNTLWMIWCLADTDLARKLVKFKLQGFICGITGMDGYSNCNNILWVIKVSVIQWSYGYDGR